MGNSPKDDDLEGSSLGWNLRRIGGMSKDEHVKDVDSKVACTLERSPVSSALLVGRGSLTQQRPPAKAASAACNETTNRGVGERKRAAANTLGGSIMNEFVIAVASR